MGRRRWPDWPGLDPSRRLTSAVRNTGRMVGIDRRSMCGDAANTERSKDMRRDYKYLYHAAPIPIVGPAADYDPVRTYMERRDTASRLAKQPARVHLANTVEFWIELIVPSLLTLVMLPVLWVVGLVMLARALWRRYVRDRGRQRTSDHGSRSYARRSWSARIERIWRARQHRSRRIRGRQSSRRARVLSPRRARDRILTALAVPPPVREQTDGAPARAPCSRAVR
jgi:hypothetical protein